MSVSKVSVKNATHDEWMEQRSKTVGGSEAGAVVGLSPYMSPFAMWCQKTGRSKPFEGNLATEVGTYLEEFVAQKFEEETGLEVKRSNYIYFNDEFPNQHATPDRLLKSTTKYGLKGLKCGLEIKTTNTFGRFKDGSFPEIYNAQCVQYLAVMEYDIWFLAVLVGNREFHIYELKRDECDPVPAFVESFLIADESEVNALRDACDEFMTMVRNDTPPLADGDESTTDALNDTYPEAQEGSKTWLEGQEENAKDLYNLIQQQMILLL